MGREYSFKYVSIPPYIFFGSLSLPILLFHRFLKRAVFSLDETVQRDLHRNPIHQGRYKSSHNHVTQDEWQLY